MLSGWNGGHTSSTQSENTIPNVRTCPFLNDEAQKQELNPLQHRSISRFTHLLRSDGKILSTPGSKHLSDHTFVTRQDLRANCIFPLFWGGRSSDDIIHQVIPANIDLVHFTPLPSANSFGVMKVSAFKPAVAHELHLSYQEFSEICFVLSYVDPIGRLLAVQQIGLGVQAEELRSSPDGHTDLCC